MTHGSLLQRSNMRRVALIAGLLSCAAPLSAQDNVPHPDFTKEPTLYVVGYAHLDTEWRWTYPQTIREYIPATLDENFALIKKYPDYVFNFSGSRRYQMMREYYPAQYAKLQEIVAAGRWFPCGSSVDENDANVPSAESLVRHVLYGNRWFRRELGTASEEYMLPDCFGFPAALPSVLAHCGIQGFSTQKLTWNAVVPIPFKVGVWIGPDGRGVVAALDPGSYGGEVLENLANSEGWKKRMDASAKASGLYVDYHYYGTGDQGGGPTDRSVAKVEESVQTKGLMHVVSGAADWLFKAITPEMRAKLPTYKGELQLTEHSAGSITSEAYMKRWNRKNELLGDAAERASVAAAWLGGRAYPAQRLEDAWTLVLGSQMHDILPGTSHPHAYDFAWNDEVLAGNVFSAVLTDAISSVASTLDTRRDGLDGEDLPVIVFNPLSIAREDVVEADVPGDSAVTLHVVGPDGREVQSQVLARTSVGNRARSVPDMYRVAFQAKVAPLSFSVFDVKWNTAKPGERPVAGLKVEPQRLENERYVVKLSDDGDVASIFDKTAQRELLSAPARLELHYENPRNWPAWNQDWADRQKPVREYVGGPARFDVVESGQARVAVRVTRTLGSSTFAQTIRLCAGDGGNRVEFDTQIDWAQRERSLRASFPLTVSNALASYDVQTGVLERPAMHKEQYEYCSNQWFDLTDAKGDYGVSVMNDCKYGSDRPDDHTLRLTLLHTPGTHGGYEDQGSQDLGRHHVLYAIEGHAGDWRTGKSAQQAERVNQPLRVFRSASHRGTVGKSLSLMKTSDDNVRITALKKIEDGDDLVVRLRELSGHDAKDVVITAASPILSAREIDGQERDVGPATVKDGALVANVQGFGLRAYALKLGPPATASASSQSASIELAFDTDVVSTNDKRTDGSMGNDSGAIPAEQLPATITAEEATFVLGPTGDGAKNAVACNGQEIALPKSGADRLYLLAASNDGDVNAEVAVDGKTVPIHVDAWNGFVGGWDKRLWLGVVPEQAYGWSNALGGIVPGFVKQGHIAWWCSHHHTDKGDAYYLYSYLWSVAIDLPKDAKSVRLPKDPRILVLAASAVTSSAPPVVTAAPLFDTLAGREQDAPRVVAADDAPHEGAYRDATTVRIEPRLYWRPDSIRYTVDGNEPTPNSAVFATPFILGQTTMVRTAVFDENGHRGPVTSAKIVVEDDTPPTVTRARLAYGSPMVHVAFSEPVDDTARSPQSYSFEPSIAVTSVQPGDDPSQVVLTLAAPPVVGRAYKLKVSGVKDFSPARNVMRSVALDVAVKGPVFEMKTIAATDMGKETRDVPGLPIKAGDSWTINVFVRADKAPQNRTLIAGFGNCAQGVDGGARYLAKWQSGIHFWSDNRDASSKAPFDVGRWQMLTATYDGTTCRIYKDGKKVGEREVQLADDQNVVDVAPIDPWEKERRFAGEISGFTIWDQALGEEALATLLFELPKEGATKSDTPTEAGSKDKQPPR